jgi:glycogen phosphorylase
VSELQQRGYRPREYYESNSRLREVLDSLVSGPFAQGGRDLFRPMFDALLYHDTYLLLADYQAYVDCQARVSLLWRDPAAWSRQAILNVARIGKFSSDRSIREYCEKIWKVKPIPLS